MSADEHLNPLQFHYVKPDKELGQYDEAFQFHTLHATRQTPEDKEHLAGTLRWSPKTGRVHKIETYPEDRRQGVATGLWHEANRLAQTTRGVNKPRHTEDRTNDGELWARSLGERLPKRDLRGRDTDV